MNNPLEKYTIQKIGLVGLQENWRCYIASGFLVFLIAQTPHSLVYFVPETVSIGLVGFGMPIGWPQIKHPIFNIIPAHFWPLNEVITHFTQ